MTDLLPECPIPQHPENAVCFCPALRACEKRAMRSTHRGRTMYAHGYAAGVQAARDAVAAIDACPECSIDDALAAIDALAGDADA